MIYLKQSTAVTVSAGPFLDKGDGITPETGLTTASSGVKIKKEAGSFAAKNESTAIAHDDEGFYDVVFDATDTGTLGQLRLAITDEATHISVWEDFVVLAANVYDSLIGGGDTLDIQVAGTDDIDLSATQKASVNAEADTALTDYDPPTRTEATSDKVAIIAEVDANETKIDTAITNIAAVKTVVDAILVDTDATIPGLIAALNDVSTADVNAQCDLAISDAALATAAGIAALNNISAADVNTQVVDVMRVDTLTENAQGVPPTNPTFQEAFMFLYMAFANQGEASSTLLEVKNAAGVVIAKSTLADVANVFTRAKFVSGP